jgi:hypothetical protein
MRTRPNRNIEILYTRTKVNAPSIHHKDPIGSSKSDTGTTGVKRTEDETRGFLRVDTLRTKIFHGSDALCRVHRAVDSRHKVAGIKKFFLNDVQVARPVGNGIRDFGSEKHETGRDCRNP